MDTALLAANGSATRAAREALSLVVAGTRQRLRAESHRSLREGTALLAGVLAVVNLAVALGGIALGVHPPPPVYILGAVPTFGVVGPSTNPYVVDWWWIAFAVAAAGIVLGLALGNRRLAVGAAAANLGLVGYDAIFVASGLNGSRGHLAAFTDGQMPGFPGGRHWLPAAVVLALAAAAASPRRRPLKYVPLALATALLLVVLSRETSGSFFFLLWPLAAIVVLAIAFGALAPRLAVVAVGAALVAVPSVVGYLTAPYIHHDLVVRWVVAPGLGLGIVLPLAYLTRRRLT